MMMSIVFLVWWLLPRTAIETRFLMPRRESESMSASPSALSYLYIFRNWWSYPTKPHNYSSKIVVQVLNMKSLSSTVVLWAQSKFILKTLFCILSFYSCFTWTLKYLHFCNSVSLLLWKLSEMSAGFSSMWMDPLVPHEGMVSFPESFAFFYL